MQGREDEPPQTRYTLRCNTASIMKDLILIRKILTSSSVCNDFKIISMTNIAWAGTLSIVYVMFIFPMSNHGISLSTFKRID